MSRERLRRRQVRNTTARRWRLLKQLLRERFRAALQATHRVSFTEAGLRILEERLLDAYVPHVTITVTIGPDGR